MTDAIARLAGLRADPPLLATRHERSKVALATQACEDLLLGDSLAGDLSQAERLVFAAEQARVSGIPALEAEYRARAIALGDAVSPALRRLLETAGSTTGNARLDAMLHFVRTWRSTPPTAIKPPCWQFLRQACRWMAPCCWHN